MHPQNTEQDAAVAPCVSSVHSRCDVRCMARTRQAGTAGRAVRGCRVAAGQQQSAAEWQERCRVHSGGGLCAQEASCAPTEATGLVTAMADYSALINFLGGISHHGGLCRAGDLARRLIDQQPARRTLAGSAPRDGSPGWRRGLRLRIAPGFGLRLSSRSIVTIVALSLEPTK